MPLFRKKTFVSQGLVKTFGVLVAVLVLVFVAEVEFVDARGLPRLRPKSVPLRSVGAGENLRLVCPVESDTPAMVEWRHNGTVVSAGWERFRIKPDQSLHVRELEASDSGLYTCQAVNGFGHVEFTYYVAVTVKYPGNVSYTVPPPSELEALSSTDEPPTFWPDVSSDDRWKQQPAGSTAWLNCRANGKPRPLITWYKDGRPLHPFDARSEGGNVGGGGGPPSHRYTLKISNLTTDDSGVYMCWLENRAGTTNITFTLEVIARATDPPEFIAPFIRNLTVQVGDTVSFHCHMRSYSQPNIQWLKRVDHPHDDRYLNATIKLRGQKFAVLQRGQVVGQKNGTYLSKLHLSSATVDDAGLYICAAANNHGFGFKSAFLTVFEDQGPSVDHVEQQEVTSSSYLPLMPIVVTLFIVVVVSLTCAVLRLYLMRAKTTANRPPHPHQPKKFKTAPFGPQRALPGFAALPAGGPTGSAGKPPPRGHYTYLESRTSPMSEDSEEAAASRFVRVLCEAGGGGGTEDSRVLVECAPPLCQGHGGGGGGGGGGAVLSLQQHRHHHTHLHYKCGAEH